MRQLYLMLFSILSLFPSVQCPYHDWLRLVYLHIYYYIFMFTLLHYFFLRYIYFCLQLTSPMDIETPFRDTRPLSVPCSRSIWHFVGSGLVPPPQLLGETLVVATPLWELCIQCFWPFPLVIMGSLTPRPLSPCVYIIINIV